MAEAIETAIAELAVKKLVNKGYGVIKYVMDLESELKRLQNTRTLIEAALLDADSMSEQYSHTEQDTLEKLSCQLDRLLDLLDVRASKELQKQVTSGVNFKKEWRSFFSTSNQIVARYKDARKVEDIKKKLSSIELDHAMIGRICCLSTQARSVQIAELSHVLPNLVVGRDKDRDRVVSMLSEDSTRVVSESLPVASIVGIGGVGKTALAWYVYNDERMKHCFDVQFWISVTQDFDIKKMLGKIIVCGAGELPSDLCDIDQLYHNFRQAIGGKKFLVVLDNIWDHDGLRQKWVDLRDLLLAHAADGSWVLITTRNLKVAEIMSTVKPHILGNLTEDDSWILFQKFAFTQWQEPGVEAIGKEITNMCPKMPLVTRSIGSLLAGKRTVQEWNAFRDDQLANNFASYGLDVRHKLKLSYDQLDAKQKLCVIYCTLFQKGSSFPKDEMIHRWMALDYIQPIYVNQSLEEAGEEYMINLHDCGFLELSDFDNATFTMQDLMYELVYTLAGFKYKVINSNTDEVDKRVRHLSFWKAATDYKKEYWEVPSSVSKIKHLHSLVRGNPIGSEKLKGRNFSMCDELISRLNLVRVLDLYGMAIKELPTSIGELICLRFLNLSETDILKLPNSIMRLVNLQSLYLNNCSFLEELPKNISKLVNLRHLKLKGSEKLRHMPKGLDNLTDLTTLDVFIVGDQTESEDKTMGRLADLNQLNNLRGDLYIEVRTESKYIMSSEISAVNLKTKKNLLKLSIYFKNGTKEDERVLECLQPPSNLKVLKISGYGGERLPGWMVDGLERHLPNLVELYFTYCKECKNLCSLERLPHMKFLQLEELGVQHHQ